MRSEKRLLGVLCVAAVVFWLGLGRGQPATAAPLTEADVQKLLDLGMDNQTIATSIHENGIAFRFDSRALDRFKTAGASKEVLDALRRRTPVRHRSRPAPPPRRR